MTREDISKLAKRVGTIVREVRVALEVKIDSLATENARLREIVKSQGEIFQLKIAEVTRQCEANKRHIGNLQSKYDKDKP